MRRLNAVIHIQIRKFHIFLLQICFCFRGHPAEPMLVQRSIIIGSKSNRRSRTITAPDKRRSGPWWVFICIFNTQSYYNNKMPLNTCSAARYGLSSDTRYHRDAISVQTFSRTGYTPPAIIANYSGPRASITSPIWLHIFCLPDTKVYLELTRSKGLAWNFQFDSEMTGGCTRMYVSSCLHTWRVIIFLLYSSLIRDCEFA